MSAQPRRQKKCRTCRGWFSPRDSLQVTCTLPCALTEAKRRSEREMRQERRKGREKLKTLSALCVEAQIPVNEYVRLRDKDKGCISCVDAAVTDAGHFYPVGSKYRTSRLRFDVRQIHGQCSKCNRFTGGGNIMGYIDGIISRYGESRLQELKDLKRMADTKQLPLLTKDEVRSIAAEFRKKVRELKAHG